MSWPLSETELKFDVFFVLVVVLSFFETSTSSKTSSMINRIESWTKKMNLGGGDLKLFSILSRQNNYEKNSLMRMYSNLFIQDHFI